MLMIEKGMRTGGSHPLMIGVGKVLSDEHFTTINDIDTFLQRVGPLAS